MLNQSHKSKEIKYLSLSRWPPRIFAQPEAGKRPKRMLNQSHKSNKIKYLSLLRWPPRLCAQPEAGKRPKRMLNQSHKSNEIKYLSLSRWPPRLFFKRGYSFLGECPFVMPTQNLTSRSKSVFICRLRVGLPLLWPGTWAWAMWRRA